MKFAWDTPETPARQPTNARGSSQHARDNEVLGDAEKCSADKGRSSRVGLSSTTVDQGVSSGFAFGRTATRIRSDPLVVCWQCGGYLSSPRTLGPVYPEANHDLLPALRPAGLRRSAVDWLAGVAGVLFIAWAWQTVARWRREKRAESSGRSLLRAVVAW